MLLLVSAWHSGMRPCEARTRESPNPAKVVTATFVGGKGSEWLSAGIFLPSGDILVCGVTLDADITLRGVKAKAIGTDIPPLPRFSAYRGLGAKDTGKVAVPDPDKAIGSDPGGLAGRSALEEPPTKEQIKRKQKEVTQAIRSCPRGMQWGEGGQTVESQVMYRKLSWFQPEATGFLAVLSPDLKTVGKFCRLPRGAGSITAAALGKDGAVYIAGTATERIAKLCGRFETETVPDPKGVTDSTFGCRHTYLARWSPDLSKVEWLRDLNGWSIAPSLRVLNDGTISLHGPGLRTYTPAGRCVRAVSIQNTRVVSGLAVNPVDGRYIRVGDWMSGTGREPYRNPRLYVYNPDGTTHKHLYGWRGPFVGVDSLRLVADSAVRKCVYDDAGNLIVSTWSHGGNNAMFRYPYDIERYVPNRLGHTPMSTCVSVIKMGPDHNVVASTRTSAWRIQDMARAVDGSIVWQALTKIVALSNALSDVESASSIVVTDPNLTGYRFFSPMPACGTRVAVGGCNDMVDGWAFATGRSNGRPMLLCLTGALPEEKIDGKAVPPPLKNAVQPTFGGGLMDGYALLLDLTATKPWPEYVEEARPPRKRKPYDGPPLAWPAEGQVFDMGTERYVTVKATFRDENDAKWPSFYAGRAVLGGRFVYGAKKTAADFVLDCPTVLQEEGLQRQRVCGELVSFTVRQGKDRKGRPRQISDLDNKVKLVVKDVSPWQREGEVARYGTRCYPRARCTIGGELQVGSRTVAVRGAECSGVFLVPKRTDTSKPGTRPNKALLVTRFKVPGKAIGLGGGLAEKTIRVKFTCSAASAVDYSAQIEKTKLPTLD